MPGFLCCSDSTSKIHPTKQTPTCISLYESPVDTPNNNISTRDDQIQQKTLPKNIMRFQKYNIVTFLPVFLFLYFIKFTNMYFLIMTIMFMIPAISPYTNMAGVFPLTFITIVAMIREIFEDFQRYRNDKTMNQSTF